MSGRDRDADDDGIEIGDARFLPGRAPAPPVDPEALPASWWGARRPRPEVRQLPDLVAGGMLAVECAAFLWHAVEAGASLVVCSGPAGVGKSTLLTALLSCLPEERALRFALGPVDPLRRDRGRPADAFAIAIPEISPHLPAYVWGPGLGRLLELRRNGAQLLATAHASDPADFVRQVTVYPNDLALEQVARFDLLIFLRPGEGDRPGRLERIVGLRSDPRGLDVIALAGPDSLAPAAGRWLEEHGGAGGGVHGCDISHSISTLKTAQTAGCADLRAAGRLLRAARGR